MFETLSDHTESTLESADLRADEGDLEGAVAVLSKAIPTDNREGQMVLLWQRARLRRQQLRVTEAIADLTAIIELAPELAAPYLERGQLRVTGAPLAAADDFTAALARRDDASTRLLRAGALREAVDRDGAIADYDAVLAAEAPRLAEEARDGRALARQLRAMLAKAEPRLQGDLEELLDRGDAAMADDPASALSIYEKAAAIAPDDPRAALGLRLARSRLTKTAQAEVAAMKSREHPDLLAPLLLRADALRRNGRVDDALEVLHGATEHHPSKAEIYYEIGLTLSCWARDHERAVSWIDRALALDPGHLGALRYRGLAFKELGAHARAVADFDRIAQRVPADRTVYMNRGLCHLLLGRYRLAERDFSAHLQIEGTSEWVFSRRAEARTGLGDIEGALADLTAAIATMESTANWKSPAPYLARADVYLRDGQRSPARADLVRALAIERERGFTQGIDTLEARLADFP